MSVSDGLIVQFPWILGEGWGWEAIDNGVDQ